MPKKEYSIVNVNIEPSYLTFEQITGNDAKEFERIAKEVLNKIQNHNNIIYEGMELYKGEHNGGEYTLYSNLSGKLLNTSEIEKNIFKVKEEDELNPLAGLTLKVDKEVDDYGVSYVSVNKDFNCNNRKYISITEFFKSSNIEHHITHDLYNNRKSLIIYSTQKPRTDGRKFEICYKNEDKMILRLGKTVNTQENYQAIPIIILAVLLFLFPLMLKHGDDKYLSLLFVIGMGNLLFFMSAYSIINLIYNRYYESNVFTVRGKLYFAIFLIFLGGAIMLCVSNPTKLATLLSAFAGVGGTYLARFFELYEIRPNQQPETQSPEQGPQQ